ncbi:hypothetical protein CPB83DRAFT_887033 [Crepidotus variabilis]|uniref:Uncharacterized protein n=1 Tax=Crepidotus variabilis TaxID=179855 RepID=A0A9P6E6H8_9AGAR|nr:hypothetical protein CPB83DRAFT_887033 [Crepidotus variabilis]
MTTKINGPWILFQHGSDPQKHHYQDQENNLAYKLEEFTQKDDPNRVIRLARDVQWAQQRPTAMGPDNSYFYLGPENNIGYLIYGSTSTRIPMSSMLRGGKKEGSVSRYWKGQNGSQYKWKVTPTRMECLDNGRTLALWEVNSSESDHYSKLTLYPKAIPLITEVLTTLILNQMALKLEWYPLDQDSPA